jgi:glycosyltransferase involved in cell wall biosynthesis
MKILHVEGGKHYYGGARQVAYLVEGLAEKGIANVLACPTGAELASAPGMSTQADIYEMPMGGDADAGMAWRLARLIRATRPDIVHLHSRRGADLWGGVAARMTGTACVLSRRVDNPESRLQVALKYRLYNHVITISQGIAEVLRNEGLPSSRMTCVRDAIDATPFLHAVDRHAFTREFNLPNEALVVGMVAQMIPRKGHRYLIQAVEALRNDYPALRVLLFGKGPLQGPLEQDIAQRGLADVIWMAGFRSDLPRWLGGLDLLVHPADMEGLGVSLLQASAAEAPIIASRVGGLPEAVLDGVNGLLIPPGDVPALIAAMRRLLDDPVLRRRFGAAGRARVLAEFSVDEMVNDHLVVYRSVVQHTTMGARS